MCSSRASCGRWASASSPSAASSPLGLPSTARRTCCATSSSCRRAPPSSSLRALPPHRHRAAAGGATRPRRPSLPSRRVLPRGIPARGRGVDRDVAHDQLRPFDGRRPPPVLSNAPHRAPRPPRPARRRARRVRDAHRRRRRPQHLRDVQRRVPGAVAARRAESRQDDDRASRGGAVLRRRLRPARGGLRRLRGADQAVRSPRLLLERPPAHPPAPRRAGAAALRRDARSGVGDLCVRRPLRAAAVHAAVRRRRRRAAAVRRQTDGAPSVQIGGPVAVVTEFALLVNAAVALGLAYGDSSHFFSTTIGHGEASGIALGLLVRTSLCYGVFALAMQRWTTIKAATGDAIVEFLVAAQLYEPAQRLAEGYTDADADADEAASSMASMRYGGGSTTTASACSSSRAAAARGSRCCRGANVERVSPHLLAVVGDAAPPLHRPPPARRVGDAPRRTLDRVRECGHLRRRRRRDAHPLLRLVAREDAAGKTMLGRLLEVAIADPLPPVSGAPAPAAGEPVSPYVPLGSTPRARGGRGEQDPDQPRARSDLELPDGLRGCCAGRWPVADVPPEDSKMGDLSATVARWEVTGFGPALDRVLGDADGFRVVVPPGHPRERRQVRAPPLDRGGIGRARQAAHARRAIRRPALTSPLSRRAARSRPWAGWAAAAAGGAAAVDGVGEGGGGAHRRRRRARRQPALALADAQLDRVFAVDFANVDALDKET